MALQWSVACEHVDDPDKVEEWLQRGYEPFAVANDKVWMKIQFFNEDNEPKSSTKMEVPSADN